MSHLPVFHILMSIVLDHERCIEWYTFTHLCHFRRHKVQRYASLCFQRGFLRNGYAT